MVLSQLPVDAVFCDWCGEDYTDSTMIGGVILEDLSAVCPECAATRGIPPPLYHCPLDIPFFKWILDFRQDDRIVLMGWHPGKG